MIRFPIFQLFIVKYGEFFCFIKIVLRFSIKQKIAPRDAQSAQGYVVAEATAPQAENPANRILFYKIMDRV